MMSIEDKRIRKNEMVRIRRATSKNSVMDTGMSEPDSVTVLQTLGVYIHYI
jgi:hypothetical protein